MDYSILSIVLSGLLLLIFCFFSLRNLKNFYLKIILFLFTIFYFIYSGIGISLPEVHDLFYFNFFLFYIYFFAGLIIVDKLKIRPLKVLNLHPFVLNLLALIYLISQIFPIIYPNFLLFELFDFRISLIDIFNRDASIRNNVFLYLNSLVSVLTLPFYYFLLKKLSLKSLIKSALLFIFVLFLQIRVSGYISRSVLIILCIFGLLILFSKYYIKNRFFYLKPKFIFIIFITIIIFFVSVNFFFDFIFIRVGVPVPNFTYLQKLLFLLESETNYPRFYATALSNFNLENTTKYLIWLFTLPFPKNFIDISPDSIINVNISFSILFTNLSPSDNGFFVVLPSMLGESLFIFGPVFFGLQAFLFTIIIGLIIKTLAYVKNSEFFIFHLISIIVFSPRGGSQGTIAIVINSFLALFVLLLAYKLGKRFL